MEVRGLRGHDRYLPHMLGHEGSGIVVATGEGVGKVATGDRSFWAGSRATAQT